MINAVFIIRKGICIFSRQYGEKNIESDRFSALIEGLNRFAENISGGVLQQVILGKDTYYLSVINDILFVYQHDELKSSKLEKISKTFSDKFFELFHVDLIKTENNPSVYVKFETEADDILKMKGKPFHKKMHDFASKF
ncbi:MAG: hypothetical protein JW891_02420 [Candidatus Lokiarchaeota archaeon]|nr:hypothetical protein [Candidatus Lokiarchaeota archaeon]